MNRFGSTRGSSTRHGVLGTAVIQDRVTELLDIDAVIREAWTSIYGELDVFEEEPLPASSPLWRHPHVIVTPHNAADSEPDSLTRYILAQIAAHEAGKPLQNVVDRKRGY